MSIHHKITHFADNHLASALISLLCVILKSANRSQSPSKKKRTPCSHTLTERGKIKQPVRQSPLLENRLFCVQ